MREAVTGAIEIRYRGRLMHWTEFRRRTAGGRAGGRPAGGRRGGRARPRPNADHPWRRGYVERQRVAELARP